ncbi:MAG: hypothetical protein IT381_28775 [Deltaproteobacteria bacterium]|nr:hypothetical protein [Deltaproteobacteria bacterium]
MASTAERAALQIVCLGCQAPELTEGHWLYCERYGLPYFDDVDIEGLLADFVEVDSGCADVIPFPAPGTLAKQTRRQSTTTGSVAAPCDDSQQRSPADYDGAH